jgi:hypothetical protein
MSVRSAVLGSGKTMIVGSNSRDYKVTDNLLIIGHDGPIQPLREHFSKPTPIGGVMSILRHDYIIYIV